MVPEISMAAVISNEPRRIELSIIKLLLLMDKVCQSSGTLLQRKKQAKLRICLLCEGNFAKLPN
jgi:hypothetical protein